QLVKKPVPPAVKDSAWPRSDIDRFLLAAMETKNVRPVGDADRRALIRRVNFDLIGLPPTPEEIEGFIADQSPDAFAHLVDRLLAVSRSQIRSDSAARLLFARGHLSQHRDVLWHSRRDYEHASGCARRAAAHGTDRRNTQHVAGAIARRPGPAGQGTPRVERR